MNANVKICLILASWQADKLGGVDGRNVPELYLVSSEDFDKYGLDSDCDSQKVHQVCDRLGMDCSKFVLCHADLGPGNIIVENVPEAGTVGIIDWEVAGFFPKEWIRTKFRISGGLNLPDSATDPLEWRHEVQKSLGEHGFEDRV